MPHATASRSSQSARASLNVQETRESRRSGTLRRELDLDYHGKKTVAIRYAAAGAARLTPVLVMGGISAGRHAAAGPRGNPGWWRGVAGRGQALDPAGQRLIGFDFVDGWEAEGGIKGPRRITTRDQARAVRAVLDHLGVERVSVVGASYGGMAALAFQELFPERVNRLVVLCAAHRTHPMATARRALQREMVRFGIESGSPARGVKMARALAMTTYRSPQEFELRFDAGRLPGPLAAPARFPVEKYLEARGDDFARVFDAERFLCLSESIDLHRTSARKLMPEALLVSVDSDALAPPWLVQELAAASGAKHVVLSSLCGHDAFLTEQEAVSSLLREALGVSPRLACAT